MLTFPRKMEMAVAMPVYNEERVLWRNIWTLHEFTKKTMGGEKGWSIVIVDNGSTDRTREIVRALTETLPNVRWIGLKLKGRGGAIKAAWSEESAKVLCYMDIDLSTELSALRLLVGPLLEGKADLAIGSRLLRNSMTERGMKREWISRAYMEW